MSRPRVSLTLAAVAFALACTGGGGSSSPSHVEKNDVAVAFQAADTASAASLGYGQASAEQAAAPGPANRRSAGGIGGGLGTGGGGAVGDVSGRLRGVDVGSGSQGVDVNSLPVDATAPMIVRSGTATIKVDSIAPAIAGLRIMAQRLGGYVGTTSIQVGAEQLRSASVELKVPAGRWNQLLDGMKPLGVLEHQEESAADVGEEYVDVAARVENAHHLEARLVDLLATRTGKLSDALEVERELARVREEIERYEGRLRFLRSRSAISTMTVTLHEPAPAIGEQQPGDHPIADAFRTAWGLFVGLLAMLISSLGIVIPLGLLIALLWWIRRGWVRRAAAA